MDNAESMINNSDTDVDGIEHDHLELCYTFLLQHESIRKGPNDPRFKEDFASLELQARNIGPLIADDIQQLYRQCLLARPAERICTPQISRKLDAALVLAWYQHWSRPKSNLAETVATIAHLLEDHSHRGEAYFCSGKISFRLDSYENALMSFDAAKASFQRMNNPMCMLRGELEFIDALLWSGDEPPKNTVTALNELPLEIGTTEAHALLVSHMANQRWFDTKHSAEVIEGAKSAVQQFLALNMPLQAADCLYRLARTYGVMERYTEGLEIIEESIKTYDELGIAGRGLGVFVHIVKARYLKASGIWGPELTDSLKTALHYAQGYGVPLATAQAMEEWAEVFVRDEDWISAKLAYACAMKECVKIESETGRIVAHNCWNNMEYIKLKERGQRIDEDAFAVPTRY